jgi:glycine cleavage system aminomethyltransferase T
LHHWHAAAGARFAEVDGWLVPAAYAGVERETTAASSGLALADVSPFAKGSLLGRGVPGLYAERFRDTPATRPGGVALLAAGGADLACRLTDDHLLLLGSTARPELLSGGLERIGAAFEPALGAPHSDSILTRDVTSAYAGFWLIGPQAVEMLRHLTALDLAPAAFPTGSCAQTSLAGVHALLVHPPANALLPSVRVCVAWELGEYVWGRLVEAGRPRGLTPLGHDALRTLVRPAPG